MNKKYWLFIEPYCFIFLKKNNALIFNSLSSSKVEVEISGKLGKFIKELKASENMYCIEISERDLEDIIEFVNNLRTTFSGDISDVSLCKIKPTIMYPGLKLQRQIKTLKKLEEMPVGTNILTYLNEILIQINGDCNINCRYCSNLYKQTLFCTKNSKQLKLKDIKKMLNQLKGTAVHSLNITGGNIFKYSELNELILHLNSLPYHISYHLHYKNLLMHLRDVPRLINKNSSISIKVNFPIEEDKISSISNKLRIEKIYHNWNFLISTKEEYKKYEEICVKLSLEDTEIVPIYNDFNIAFFKDNVYLNKEDIFLTESKRSEVFSKSVLNINHFGKLTIMANGKVYSNVNNKSIGNMEQPLTELVYIEMMEGNSWLDIRDKKPCTECVYQWLCPSPSNYEKVLGKNNLCHVWANN